MTDTDRSVAPVIGEILLVAIVVILASVLAVYALGFTDSATDPAPTIGQSTGELVAGNDTTEQVVTIKHQGGDAVDVSELEIIVDATADCDAEARLVDLPSDGGLDETIVAANIEGEDDLIDQSPGLAGPLIGTAGSENTFVAGTKIEFRIPVMGCDFRLSDNDTVTIQVIHVPSNTILIDERLTAN